MIPCIVNIVVCPAHSRADQERCRSGSKRDTSSSESLALCGVVVQEVHQGDTEMDLKRYRASFDVVYISSEMSLRDSYLLNEAI